MDELKPCPFCGGKPIIKRTELLCAEQYYVLCKCGLLARFVKDEHNKEQVINRWNSEEYKHIDCFMFQLRPEEDIDGCKCSNCNIIIPFLTGKDFNFCPKCGARVIRTGE